ncbi:hypothetical protein M1403_04040 [Patescibacteria group bacterium]|nr:hypothetical protein [Patescibacteria group bacterium]
MQTLPLRDSDDLLPLIRLVGQRSVAGFAVKTISHEFTNWKTEITKKLIVNQGFDFLVVPECAKTLDEYVRRLDGGKTAYETLRRCPKYATWEMLGFLEWLRDLNDGLPDYQKISFVKQIPKNPDPRNRFLFWEKPRGVKIRLETGKNDELILVSKKEAVIKVSTLRPVNPLDFQGEWL